jgi:hypothetical protein
MGFSVRGFLHKPQVSSEKTGSTEHATPGFSQTNTGHAPRERANTSTPSVPFNRGSGAARPSTAREKLFGVKSQSVGDWGRQAVPGEQRKIAETRINTALKLDALDIFYGDFSKVNLLQLGLTDLPIKSLLKLHSDCTVLIDMAKLPPAQLAQLTEAVNKKHYCGPTFEPGPKNASQNARAEHAAQQQARFDAENERFKSQQAPLKPERVAKNVDPSKVGVDSITDSASALEAVHQLKSKGFSDSQLQELKRDIREYGNHGDLNNGADWFNKKYATAFDKKISEPGQPVHFAKLIAHLPTE